MDKPAPGKLAEPGVVIYWFGADLYYANANYFAERAELRTETFWKTANKWNWTKSKSVIAVIIVTYAFLTSCTGADHHPPYQPASKTNPKSEMKRATGGS